MHTQLRINHRREQLIKDVVMIDLFRLESDNKNAITHQSI